MRIIDRFTVLNGVSLGSDITSGPIDVKHLKGFSIIAAWTGDAQGTLKLEASNSDYSDPNRVPSAPIWTDITGSSVTVNGAGENGWNVTDAFYAYVRIVFTRVSSTTGTITAEACAKE